MQNSKLSQLVEKLLKQIEDGEQTKQNINPLRASSINSLHDHMGPKEPMDTSNDDLINNGDEKKGWTQVTSPKKRKRNASIITPTDGKRRPDSSNTSQLAPRTLQPSAQATRTSASHNKGNITAEVSGNSNRNEPKPSPIILHENAVKQTITLLSTKIKDFYIKRINANKQILQTNTLPNHKIVCETLKLNNIHFFHIHAKTEKKITVLLKDLEGNFETETILEELNNKKNRQPKLPISKKIPDQTLD